MVMHWRKNRGPHWLKSALVNGFGAFVTGITVVGRAGREIREGAWITLLFIPLTIVFFVAVRRHYHSVKCSPRARFPSTRRASASIPLPSFPSTAGATSPARELNLPPGFHRK
jgi:hypothetical protein